MWEVLVDCANTGISFRELCVEQLHTKAEKKLLALFGFLTVFESRHEDYEFLKLWRCSVLVLVLTLDNY